MPAGKDDEIVVERTLLKGADAADSRHSRLNFGSPLLNAYDRWTVTILGNVAPATHGETVGEVLGGGDAARRSSNSR